MEVPATNRLLAALPLRDRKRFLARAELVELKFSDVLSIPGEPIRHVYFPTDSLVSLVATVDGSSGLEVGLVGNEGVLGISLMLGVEESPLHALVQGAGGAVRMKAAPFRRELAESIALQSGLNRYLYVSMSELAQTAACTRYHLLESRLARWLMTTGDRAHSDEFLLTHELLAHRLGVRRVGVTTAAGALQKRGLIRYSRGHITILDRTGLEAAACECYRAGQDMHDRILRQAS